MEEPAEPQADQAPTPAAGPPLVIEYELTLADWNAWIATWTEDARTRAGRVRLLAAAAIPSVLGILGTVVARDDFPAVFPFAVGIACFAISVLLARGLFQRVSRPDEGGAHLGPVRMEISADGIRLHRPHVDAHARWSTFRRLTRTPTHVFLWIDTLTAYIVPLRDLPPGLTPDELVARVRAFAGPDRPIAPAPAVETDTPPPRFLGALARRLAWRVRPDGGAFSSDAVIACCSVLALAVWLAFDRYQAGEGATWYAGGAGGVAWYAGGLLLVAWALHRATSRAARYRSLLAAMVGALPLALALGLAIHAWVPMAWQWLPYALLGAAALLHVQRALVASTGGTRPWALAAGFATVLLFSWATTKAWVHPSFWYSYDEDEDSDADPVGDETLLFEQAERIDAAMARVAPGRPGRPDVFFLGFAGVGEQKVFAEELKLAEGVVARRYGTAGRSLLLVNDERDRETWPLATVPGLRRALARMAERMDPAEDVLFLLLTSHGSDDPSLSVSNGALTVSDLDGPELQDALEASGIRWRVIVISACYSGAFIDLLANDQTIVMTSADADRTSFGCGDDNEVTDFGAAFIRDALPAAGSLSTAFETAKAAIAEREAAAKLEPSLPQARFGRAIEPYWAKIEAEHDGQAGAR